MLVYASQWLKTTAEARACLGAKDLRLSVI